MPFFGMLSAIVLEGTSFFVMRFNKKVADFFDGSFTLYLLILIWLIYAVVVWYCLENYVYLKLKHKVTSTQLFAIMPRFDRISLTLFALLLFVMAKVIYSILYIYIYRSSKNILLLITH